MAIDSKDIIYVFDRGNDRIQKVTTDGKQLGALYSYDGEWLTNKDDIPLKPKPIKGKKFASSEAMAIDKDGNYYVTDTGHNRIMDSKGQNYKVSFDHFLIISCNFLDIFNYNSYSRWYSLFHYNLNQYL